MSIVNERVVLNLIESRQATSQIQIAHHLKLPANTVHGVMNRLLKAGIVQVDRIERYGRGRPIQHYRIHQNKKVLVIQSFGSVWNAGLFSGSTLIGEVSDWNTPLVKNREEALKILNQICREVLKSCRLDSKSVDEVVLAMNVNRMKNGCGFYSSVIPWISGMTEEDFSHALKVKVNLQTDFSMAAFELRARVDQGIQSLVVFRVADGVRGHGVHVHPEWASSHLFRGELGHVVVDPSGPVCGCGHRGCLEAMISGPALLQRMKSDLDRGVQTRLSEWSEKSPSEFFGALEEMDQKDDAYAKTLVRDFIFKCAWAVSIIDNLINPDVIVLTGYGLEGRKKWADFIATQARQMTLSGEKFPLRLDFPLVGKENFLRYLSQSIFQNRS